MHAGSAGFMVVSPHNPAGTVFTAGELEALGRLCRERDLPVVFDEVFSEFLSPPALSLPRPQHGAFPLVVVLNGFAKMFSLPGWKVGWMCAGGDTAFVERFLQSLEYLSDTFLPVPEPIQALVSPILRYADDAISSSLAHEITRRRDLARQSK